MVATLFLLFFKNNKKIEFSQGKDKNSEMENVAPAPENVPEDNLPSDDNTVISDADQNQEMAQNNEQGKEADKNVPASGSNNSETADNKNTSSVSGSKIINRLVSWGFQKADGRKIDTVVIHSTYNPLGGDEFGVDKIISIYKSYGVSPHYIIDRKGNIYRLVDDKNIAYHAGESEMPDGRSNVNRFSIGIEVITSKTTKPTGEQYSALKYLVTSLKNKYPIKYVLGHKDIALGRKDDPWNLDINKVK